MLTDDRVTTNRLKMKRRIHTISILILTEVLGCYIFEMVGFAKGVSQHTISNLKWQQDNSRIYFVNLSAGLDTMEFKSSIEIDQARPADFKENVENYINSLSPNFIATNETFSGVGKAVFLNTKVRAKWKKEISLEHKPNAANDRTEYPKLYYGFYQFVSKKKCKLALDSLLNCFGNDCVKIKWGESKDYISTCPSIYIINDYEILVCKTQPTYEVEFWYSIVSELKNKFEKATSRIIVIDQKGVISFEN
jgi:hypothetical protein